MDKYKIYYVRYNSLRSLVLAKSCDEAISTLKDEYTYIPTRPSYGKGQETFSKTDWYDITVSAEEVPESDYGNFASLNDPIIVPLTYVLKESKTFILKQ